MGCFLTFNYSFNDRATHGHSKEHPEHNDMLEWVGGDFDPEAFDLDSINQDLQSIR
jgi:pRiA4b ORF-3-like protein